MSITEPTKRETLNIRIKANDRGLIDHAAQTLGQTRTDFILKAAKRAAEDTLLDRTLLVVDPDAYTKFLNRLDAPASPNERLISTMKTPSPWKRKD